ncbi:type II secretion system minor pseudopilin GspJ [Budviciaceae bacterium CWB-B4]|uniref:Type II secretion system protein J n=1 Tax=Limnobaculum xujianqingii TaxID=2738837 RepID=A0A9D7FQ55_9GAMM|nr:type II secretion system minor pseudopilin GspJ [Limnobaculum xujianqingii]MBK5071534.1 type II secretion system minor pseudopilin GspJ [Limnobaculum xujianqingii]MBK5174843.1 type II secretion system minor pseudopilin GspJ [Limnobaculum xujianqingii]
MNALKRVRQQGFTMMEVIIALVIFAMISMMAWQILNGSMSNSAVSDAQSARFNQLQMTYSRLERDFSQAMPRAQVGSSAAFQLRDGILVLTTQDSVASLGNPQSADLIRVSWWLKDNQVYRGIASVLDGASPADWTRIPMIDRVKKMDWRFFNTNWQPQWEEAEMIPKGIELTLTLEDDTEWRWVFMTPGNWPKGGTSSIQGTDESDSNVGEQRPDADKPGEEAAPAQGDSSPNAGGAK